MAIAVRKLRPDDDRSTFDSGDPDLDRFEIGVIPVTSDEQPEK